MSIEVENPTLKEVNTRVDRLWTERVTAVKKNNKELQPLIHQAWSLFKERKGRPKTGEESFAGWLQERQIPRQTGYDILNRERVERGELNVRAVQFSPSTEDATEDFVTNEESPASAHNGTVEASEKLSTFDASPEHRPTRVALRPLTAEQRTKKKNELLAEVKSLAPPADFQEIQALIDDAAIAILEKRLGGFKTKRIDTKTRKAIQTSYRQETADRPAFVEV